MKLALTFATLGLLSLSVFAVGCSSSEEEGKTGPVAASPLTGSIEGKSFAAKSAIARKGFSKDDDGTRSIDIYDTEQTCDNTATRPERSILLRVPWTAGTARDFKLSFGSGDGQTATFVLRRESETDNIISTQGRVEIIEAPTEKGATGKMRLRATAKENSVEGEISVLVCD